MMRTENRNFETLVSTQYRYRPEGETEFVVATLEVSKPFVINEMVGAAAAVRFVPFDPEWIVIYGVDFYQALQLAFNFADDRVLGPEQRFELELFLPGE
jgi:hypothetical protein